MPKRPMAALGASATAAGPLALHATSDKFTDIARRIRFMKKHLLVREGFDLTSLQILQGCRLVFFSSKVLKLRTVPLARPYKSRPLRREQLRTDVRLESRRRDLCRLEIPLANTENPVLRGSVAASLLTRLEKKPRLILLGLDSFDDLFGLRCEGS